MLCDIHIVAIWDFDFYFSQYADRHMLLETVWCLSYMLAPLFQGVAALHL